MTEHGRAAAHEPQEYHPPVEEYLETMLSLAEEGVPVIQARIAERLGRSAPSVSEMLDRLSDDGYVDRDGRRLSLTESGQALAEKVVRKHRLAERLLVDVIGLEWHKVHREAGRWEHVISDDVEARLVELLGDPATCPHGNPIPGSHSAAPSAPTRPLAEVDAGERVRLRATWRSRWKVVRSPSGSRATCPTGCTSARRDPSARGRRRLHRRRR
jgi:DtxR family Mn-dependent transcriptional regulator